ncbi:MAG: outer membrane protein assembly factor BamA [Candidatus Eisenbacteria bacterium]|nr:outer membrane protein assembly factor BamA [Candidatus Eisenbacteria bacterium]
MPDAPARRPAPGRRAIPAWIPAVAALLALAAPPARAQFPGEEGRPGPGGPDPRAQERRVPAPHDPSRALKPAAPGAITPLPPAPADAAMVDSVWVSGVARVDSALVARKLGVRAGDRYNPESVRRGLRALFDLGYFSDLRLDADTLTDGTVVLTLTVQERPTVGAVEFTGNKNVDASKLRTAVGVSPGQWADADMLAAEAGRLREFYRGEGYAGAVIEARLVPPDSRMPNVIFEIREGDKVRIEAITFTGNRAFEAKQIRKALQTHPHGFLRSGTYKPEELEADVENVATFYKDRGYRQVHVGSPELAYDTTGTRLTVNFPVIEGPLERFGVTRWTGSTVFPDSMLPHFLDYRPGDVYSQAKVRKTMEAIYGAYLDRGYIFADLDPQMGTRDSLVDLQYAVTEGRQAHLRELKVTGNQRTKEKVVRRQILMRQGDVFRRTALQRSQRDVFSLGLFSNVLVDYQPAPEPNPNGDVDLTIKVEEKETGTASAGAGYSSQTGMTGFADLGHKNIFGGGQSVNLHLERGSNVSDYQLSYTEPFFKDTPTTVGFDVFNTFRNRASASVSSIATYYDTKRRGAAITLGRPVGFIDYSRFSFTYRLEDVTLTNFIDSLICKDGSATCPDSLKTLNGSYTPDITYLKGQKYPQLTSSITVYFTRNSTNNPFYATAGSALTYRLGITGGLLGGVVSFNKQVLDWKHYVHLGGPFTLMHRHRLGVLAGNSTNAKLDPVPLYELFRLGGTTEDYLRGYPDYDIVPEGNRQTLGGKWALVNSLELQFPVTNPVHGVLFLDAGNTWNSWADIKAQPLKYRTSIGLGIRMEIPMLGPIGFDYAYGFARKKWVPHILFGGQF